MLRPRHATFLLQEKKPTCIYVCVSADINTPPLFFVVSILFVYIFVYTRLLDRFNSPYHVFQGPTPFGYYLSSTRCRISGCTYINKRGIQLDLY